MFHIGIDIAWGKTNETGIVMLDTAGKVVKAEWTVGVDQTMGTIYLIVPKGGLGLRES